MSGQGWPPRLSTLLDSAGWITIALWKEVIALDIAIRPNDPKPLRIYAHEFSCSLRVFFDSWMDSAMTSRLLESALICKSMDSGRGVRAIKGAGWNGGGRRVTVEIYWIELD